MKNIQSIGDIIKSVVRNVNENDQMKISEGIKSIEELFENQKNRIDEIEKKINGSEKNIKSRTSRWWDYILLLIVISAFAVAFFLFAVWLKERFHFEISGDSIVLTFVGIAATFVVVSNYMQVKEIKDEFNDKTTAIENKTDKLIDNKIVDYDYMVTGTLYIMLGHMEYNKGGTGTYQMAFFYYMKALKNFDKAKDKTPLNGAFLGIEKLTSSRIRFRIKAEHKNNTLSLLKKINCKQEIIDAVNQIDTIKE
ncbi:MAG: hypothetical protein LBE13_21040 [Bacteroidales bacterium]|jgi:hypothetical protein|nr:hypothetical protein [Bacteroidales bacterium]